MTICIFASSSSRINIEYAKAASELGILLARAEMDVIYGGGGIGLMGKLADSVIETGGRITGVIPGFMKEEGWDHPKVSEMIITPDMGERKKQMFARADAVVTLPGGVGTLEELTEAITLKQLGLFKGSIIILNTLDFYRSFIDFLDHMIEGRFLRFEHKGMWQIAATPVEVMDYLAKNEVWIHDPRSIAKI
ncbi:MAG: Rossman fold protein, TIGR00730 family [Bacteroidetes bacterium GWE2_41_25]|nr:MAG: Rossman fold protein, TIGR00730 family [Bacteroidetes bacterium GWA2_40_15]OFX90921.1 MAG: Rossman fold protein, TIGR00730 family [Bacteroidetes bacterium GWE2_41_25]OFY01438.1 MAG: Rossman fold protein, TIGR00730 family [Bacteroidetes bacterium GWC2_40_22]OFY59314.1 MAG: Rossman fold protein, TIGR00730 family [Bacteroidetes bacterium GWF2_41_9]HAM11183.1 TIGR00730 family Rossman fold protein [Bacteroidales bacterium]